MVLESIIDICNSGEPGLQGCSTSSKVGWFGKILEYEMQ